MSDVTNDQQQDDESSFAAGFASVAGLEAGAVDVAPASEEQAEAHSSAPPDVEPGSSDAATQRQEGQGQSQDQEDQGGASSPENSDEDAGHAEPEVAAGMTNKELHNLLMSQTQELEAQRLELRKAFGKIGELNGRLRQQQPSDGTRSEPDAGAVAGGAADDGSLIDGGELSKQIAQAIAGKVNLGDFSEEDVQRSIVDAVSAAVAHSQSLLIKHLKNPAADGVAGGHPQQGQQELLPQEQPLQPAPADPRVELALLDRLRPGWQETVRTPQFNLWVSTQDAQTQQIARHGTTADEIAGLLDKFEQRNAAKAKAAAAHAKGRDRLERALTPQGRSPRPQSAPTEQDDFEAAFNAVLNR